MRERERQRKSEKSEKAREGETLDKKVKRFFISAVGGSEGPWEVPGGLHLNSTAKANPKPRSRTTERP